MIVVPIRYLISKLVLGKDMTPVSNIFGYIAILSAEFIAIRVTSEFDDQLINLSDDEVDVPKVKEQLTVTDALFTIYVNGTV